MVNEATRVGGFMMHGKYVALIGAGTLFLGVLTPIASVPIMGSISLIQTGAAGIWIVLLAAATGVLAALSRVRHVIWTGGAAMLIVVGNLISLETHIGRVRSNAFTNVPDATLNELIQTALVGSIHLQWGWAMLIFGASLIIYGGRQTRNGVPQK